MAASQQKWSAGEFAAMVIAVGTPIAFLTSIPWLKNQPDGQVYLLSAIAAMIVIAASIFLSVAGQAKMYEVQRAGSRFSFLWGGLLGACAIAVLIAIPPFQELIYRAISLFQNDGGLALDREIVLLAFTLGFCGVVVAQSISTLLINGIWRLWMSRG